MPHLIDGHNVIAALPDIDLEDEHDEAKLVLKLRAWTGRRHRKAIVIFDGGDIVTADVRLIEAARLEADESTLTGESLPVSKQTDPLIPDTLVMDRINMVFKGTARHNAFELARDMEAIGAMVHQNKSAAAALRMLRSKGK